MHEKKNYHSKTDFKQLICSLAKVAADSQEAESITPASSIDLKRKVIYASFKKRFKVALVCMAIRTQTELMIRRVRRVQCLRRTKEAAIQAACAGNNEDTIQNMEIHGSITGKTMMRIICFDHITTATTPLPHL